MAATGDLLDLSLRDFLEAVASEDPTPGGGTAAALAVAISAGLTAMVARASGDWPEAGSAVAQAERIRKRIAPLAQRDAEAYEEALVSMTLPERVEPVVRDMTVGAALWRAAEVPMAIAEAGPTPPAWPRSSPTAGTQARRADAVAAALLAEAATWAAAGLVKVNLTITAEDKRTEQARRLGETASSAARQAVQTLGAA